MVLSSYSLVAGVVLSSCNLLHARQLVLYGPDNRLNEDDPRISESMKDMGQSTFVIIGKSELEFDTSTQVFNFASSVTSVMDQRGGTDCEGNPWPFADELNPGGCSGTLIADRHVATAGHCIPDADACENYFFVFGATNAQMATRQFPRDHVYECSSILITMNQVFSRGDQSLTALRLLMQAGILPDNANTIDFAVAQLDRAVTVATPAAVRTNGSVAMNESVVVIGHPDGLPRKYAESKVNYVGRDHGGGYIWTAPFDTFGGNSGSGVFSLETNELVGIHFAGVVDFVESDDCQSFNVCPDNNPNPAADPTFIQELSTIDNDADFEDFLAGVDHECSGELQMGSSILSAPLVAIDGCSSSDNCLNGGNCNNGSNTCDCPANFYGADCSQERSRVVCNGVGEHIGYYACQCPPGTAPPLCHICGEESILKDGCYDGNEEFIDDCTCHPSCRTCGFYGDPIEDIDCRTCFPGASLEVLFADGTGPCREDSTLNDGCYDGEGELIDDCTCHPSCRTCGFYNDPTEDVDCRTCFPGGALEVLFDDNTGRCTENNGSPITNTCGTLEKINACGGDYCFIGWEGMSQRSSCFDSLSNAANCNPAEPALDFCGAQDVASIRSLLGCPPLGPMIEALTPASAAPIEEPVVQNKAVTGRVTSAAPSQLWRGMLFVVLWLLLIWCR